MQDFQSPGRKKPLEGQPLSSGIAKEVLPVKPIILAPGNGEFNNAQKGMNACIAPFLKAETSPSEYHDFLSSIVNGKKAGKIYVMPDSLTASYGKLLVTVGIPSGRITTLTINDGKKLQSHFVQNGPSVSVYSANSA